MEIFSPKSIETWSATECCIAFNAIASSCVNYYTNNQIIRPNAYRCISSFPNYDYFVQHGLISIPNRCIPKEIMVEVVNLYFSSINKIFSDKEIIDELRFRGVITIYGDDRPT